MNYDDIKTLHLEITSFCNARCPQCPRTSNQFLPLKHLTLAQIKQFFNIEFVSNLDHMYSCGNYGDPVVNPECLEIASYFKDNGCDRVSLYSNGGVRDTTFWKNLAEKKVRVVFAIDGLEDTNHIYRVGVKWKNLMNNVTEFINNGGYAEWNFLIFEHNQHQIAQAEQLSLQMGFKKFTTKATSRFVNNKKTVVNKKNQEIRMADVSLKHVKDKNTAIEVYGSWDNYIDNTPIFCKTKYEKSIYVDFAGTVWPCCWMGHKYNKDNVDKDYSHNNLNNYNLYEIVNNNWFSSQLEEGWKSGKNRFHICAKTCGEIYSPSTHRLNNLKEKINE